MVKEKIQWTRKQLAKIDASILVNKNVVTNSVMRNDLPICQRMVKRSTNLDFNKTGYKQQANFKKNKENDE